MRPPPNAPRHSAVVALAARSDRWPGGRLALERQQAHADCQAKGRPYESDWLFMCTCGSATTAVPGIAPGPWSF